MAGITQSGWPYVEPTDHPVDFPPHSLELANLLDEKVGKVGVTTILSTASGWADMGGQYAGMRLTAHSGMVTIEAMLKRTQSLSVTSQNFYLAGTIPAGMRPMTDINLPGYGFLAQYGAVRIRVQSSGEFEAFADTTTVWQADHWFGVNGTWRIQIVE